MGWRMDAQARTELDDAGLSPERVAVMLELYERARQEEGGAHQGGQEEQAAPLAEPDQDAPAAAAEVWSACRACHALPTAGHSLGGVVRAGMEPAKLKMCEGAGCFTGDTAAPDSVHMRTCRPETARAWVALRWACCRGCSPCCGCCMHPTRLTIGSPCSAGSAAPTSVARAAAAAGAGTRTLRNLLDQHVIACMLRRWAPQQ